MTITPEHLAHLRESGLTDETIALAKIRSVDLGELKEALGFRRWGGGGAICFPIVDPSTGATRWARFRPDVPRNADGKPVKYEQRATSKGGPGVLVYFPPRSLARLQGDDLVVVTEGEKTGLACDQCGYTTIALTGVSCFGDAAHRKAGRGWRLHPMILEHVRIEGRDFVICFDADAAVKEPVLKAARRLAGLLLEAGAASVRFVHPPHGKGLPKGLDDLLAVGGEDAVHELIAKAQPIEPLSSLPEIVITTDEKRVNDQALAALSNDPDLFARGTDIVHIVKGEHDGIAPSIRVMPEGFLRERMAACAQWLVPSADGVAPSHPPKWSVDAVRSRGQWPMLRYLAGLAEAPALRADGTVLSQPGYDARSGLYYIPRGASLPVPDMPSSDDVRAALELFDDILCDFHFAQPHHKSAWLAGLLTMMGRYAIDGPTPMFVVDAPVAGEGKGLLVDIASRVTTGRPKPDDGFPSSDEEIDKRVTAWALSGRHVVCMDNIGRRLGGDSLCRAITSSTVSGRRLGKTEDLAVPYRTVLWGTGNNVSIGPDMHRRVVHIRLASQCEDPSQRTGFRYPNLVAEVMRRRADLARAALVLLRGFCAVGRPDQRLRAWGSFESWSELVRGTIVWAGWPDPESSREELRAASDDKAALHRSLVFGWADLVRHEGEPITAKRAIELVNANGLDGYRWLHVREVFEELASDKAGKIDVRKLGFVLRGLRERIFDGDQGPLKLDAVRDRTNATRWSVSGGQTGAGHDVQTGDVQQHVQQHVQQTINWDSRGEMKNAGHAGHKEDHLRVREPYTSVAKDRVGRVGETCPASPASPADDLDDDRSDFVDDPESWRWS